MRLTDYVEQIVMRMHAEGYDHLLLYVDKKAELCLLIEDTGSKSRHLDTFRGLPVLPIVPGAEHPFRLIVGDSETEYAWGLDRNNEVRTFYNANQDRSSEL